MREDAVLVNTARKEVIHEDDLKKAFAEKAKFKYLTDIAPACDAELKEQFADRYLSLIHISEPTRPLYISYAVFCLKKKKRNHTTKTHKFNDTNCQRVLHPPTQRQLNILTLSNN
eukprot:TRINITY_DN20352_c0_g1_i1.p2 TRINITY_DN20352_c0_g1~~TRINITY_DN20352_c0_g1_i1.p2  ORF type:complete len:115 (-),score=20.02 TRINITY_DN20352_c0_g1_i1:24-368(-)